MGISRFTNFDQDFTQDLSAGALSFTTTTTGGKKFHLDQVVIHFSTAVTETITITVDSLKGANYDTVLISCPFASETDFVYRPEGDAIFNAGDEIKVQCTNDGAVGIAYGNVKTSEVS